jgi:1-pyrroline-5-carboxylate dehydrogenase
MQQIYRDQPGNQPGVWNRLEYRPLEGFVFAITPFNFTAIAANLPASAALMGNTVVWKPADSQVYSAHVIMELFREAGLPDGVINMITVEGKDAGDVIFHHPDFAGLHFTGSTAVFKHLWKEIGTNVEKYKTYPRIVGETGGKDFVLAHPSANPNEVATALTRGAFEFQGQKCSAASRGYIPKSLWPAVKERLIQDTKSMKMGSPEDFGNFINAVIDKRAFDKIKGYIEFVKQQPDAEVIAGGNADDSVGYCIEPTVVVTSNPKFRTMCEEIFGPVLSVVRVRSYEEGLKLINSGEFGNGTAIFTNDGGAARKFQNEVEVGMIGINVPIPVPVAYFSFGGWKHSLFGDSRAHGEEGFRFFTQTKVITSRWLDPSHGGINLGFPQN